MFKPFIINKPVFFGALLVIGAFVAVGVLLPNQAGDIFGAIQTNILQGFGWFYLLAVGIFLVTVLLLCFGRYGRLKLGPDDATPDFKFTSWIAMLFAAGMGIGLMFYAVGEPMTHFMAPPTAEPRSVAAMREAMTVTFFHWGIHAWAIYAVVGLSLAYFGYRYNLPLTIRSGLYPLLKERINGPIGHAVDIFAIVGTMFGIATSLGVGVSQINAGLSYLLDFPVGPIVQLPLIALVTALATISVATGLDRGVRILSETNLVVAILLMLFVLVVGPTAQLFRDLVQNLGLYLDTLVLRTFNIYAYQEFVTAVLFIPAGFTFIWMTVFGNTAMFIDTGIAAGEVGQAIAADVATGLFQFFQYLPFSGITSTLAILLVAIFFITSSDSGSLVVDSIAAGGETETTTGQRVFWCVMEGVVAAALLLAGGLGALQSATIASALPFTFVMLGLVWSLYLGMRADLAQQYPQTNAPAGGTAAHPAAGLTWQRRLALIMHAPDRRDVEHFLEANAAPALEQVARELTNRGRPASVEKAGSGNVALRSPAEGVRDFVYGVALTSVPVANFALAAGEPELRYEARTYFSSGGSGYDVMGMHRDQLIADVLAQFERYLQLTHSSATQLLHAAPEHEPRASSEAKGS